MSRSLIFPRRSRLLIRTPNGASSGATDMFWLVFFTCVFFNPHFVEFVSKQEAAKALAALQSTHLYGRHIVVSYAEQEQSVEEMRKKMRNQLADATISNQKALNFRTAYGPKVHGARSLHTVSATAQLNYFNVYSSAAGLMGSAGQAPHSASNTWLDAMASSRRRLSCE